MIIDIIVELLYIRISRAENSRTRNEEKCNVLIGETGNTPEICK